MKLQKITKRLAVLLLCTVVAGGTQAGLTDAASVDSGNVLIVDGVIDHANQDEADSKGEPDTLAGKPEAVKKIKPGQTKGFEVQAVKNGIKLTWKETARAQKYEIYRKKAVKEESYELIKTTKKCSYTDKEAAYGVTYKYRVRAIATSEDKTYKGKYSEARKMVTYHIDPKKPMIALTFDDGPGPYTDRILDSLWENEARATFFEVGNRVMSYPKTVARIGQTGCEIGSHSYSHANLGTSSVATINSQISRTDRNIKKLTGKAPELLRPPYGSIGTNLKNNAGKPLILWSVDTLDWKYRDSNRVYNHVMSHLSDGAIVLMHDIHPTTATAAERIIPELKKKGYQLVTVSELAQYRNVDLKAGARYSQMRP